MSCVLLSEAGAFLCMVKTGIGFGIKELFLLITESLPETGTSRVKFYVSCAERYLE